MTAIRVDLIGQLGNQLFAYCFAKVLAVRTGLSYRAPRGFMDKQGCPIRWTGEPLFRMLPSPGRSSSNERPIRLRCGHWVDLGSLDHATKIHLSSGYYQRYEYYQPFVNTIRDDWLKLQVPFVQTDPGAVYCHVRRTDYVPTPKRPVTQRQQPLAATLDEYAACLRHFPDAKRLVVCTDDPRDPWLHELDRLGLPWEISGGTWDQDLMLLMSAENLLMCQSTYSWWAGFLGRAQRIVCPVFPGTHWRLGMDGGITGPPTNGDYPSLCVDDDHRWIWETGDQG